MANMSSSSSSFSFLIVLSVLLVVANNFPTSHGRPQNVQVSDIFFNDLGNQIPQMISGIPVDIALISDAGYTAPLLLQRIEKLWDCAD
ncbi:hypothetical protein C5167_007347 [Papaver somniferum]|nr:hypothetical protein C5167_007347 [Papaver somniferum]